MSIQPEMVDLRKFARPVNTMLHLAFAMNAMDPLAQFLQEDHFDGASYSRRHLVTIRPNLQVANDIS